MVYAGDVHSDSPTSANKPGDGAAPSASLGLSNDFGVYLPFGTIAHHRVRGVKTDDKNQLVVILGLNNDGTGYRTLRVSDDPGGSVFVSQDTKAHPDLSTARSLLNASLFPTWASFVAQDCNPDDTLVRVGGKVRGGHLGTMADSPKDIEAAKVAPPPRVQAVGDSPGHGGSRGNSGVGHRRHFVAGLARPIPRGLRPPSQRRSPPRSRGPWCATRGRRRWSCGVWRPGFSKSGKSGERFQFYSRAKTFAQFDAIAKESYLSGITGTWRPKASRIRPGVGHGAWDRDFP